MMQRSASGRFSGLSNSPIAWTRTRYAAIRSLAASVRAGTRPVAGRVIWVTPKGAQGKRTAGIGVQFSDQDGGSTQKKIENYLAGALGGDKPTHTM